MMKLFHVLMRGEAPRRTALIVILVTVVGLGTASGQNLSLGWGGAIPTGDMSDSFGTGRNFEASFTVPLTEMVGVRFDYFYSRFTGRQNILIPATLQTEPTVIDATHPTHAGLFDVVVTSPTDRFKVYGLGGGGVYRRSVTLETPSTDLIPGFCDPYWFVCYPSTLVSGTAILASRRSTDFGVNVGGGVAFQISDGFAIFFEGRYHYVWGPEIMEELSVQPLSHPRTQRANGTFFPLTFGLRF